MEAARQKRLESPCHGGWKHVGQAGERRGATYVCTLWRPAAGGPPPRANAEVRTKTRVLGVATGLERNEFGNLLSKIVNSLVLCKCHIFGDQQYRTVFALVTPIFVKNRLFQIYFLKKQIKVIFLVTRSIVLPVLL